MKRALQGMLIAPDHAVRLRIMLGQKKITIREGHRDYTNGPVLIGCHLVTWAVMATITSVRLTTVAEVTENELLADGYKDHDDMLYGLQGFYPDLTMNSPVTVINWDNVTGAMTEKDNIERFAKKHHLTEMLLGSEMF